MAGLVVSSTTGGNNGWEMSNDGDVVIVVSNPEAVDYKLTSVKINLAKGVGTVWGSSGQVTGSSSATLSAYFVIGNTVSSTPSTNQVSITNTVSVKSAGSSTSNTGYFNPSNTQYTFNFINPPTVVSGGTLRITLCKSGTGVLSWANKSVTPPVVNSEISSVTPPVVRVTNPSGRTYSHIITGNYVTCQAVSSEGSIAVDTYEYRVRTTSWSGWSSFDINTALQISDQINGVQFRVKSQIGEIYSEYGYSNQMTRLILTSSVISIQTPQLVGASVTPQVVQVSTSNSSGLILYTWTYRTYDAAGNVGSWVISGPRTTSTPPSDITVVLSATVSKVEYKLISTINDTDGINTLVASSDTCKCEAKLNAPLSPNIIVSGSTSTGYASAGESFNCQVSLPTTDMLISPNVYYSTYYTSTTSVVEDQEAQSWSDSSGFVVSSRPSEVYNAIYYKVKSTKSPYYLESEEVSSSLVIIRYSPRNISQVWTTSPTYEGFGEELQVNSSLKIHLPVIPITAHEGNFNYYQMYFISNGTSTLIEEGLKSSNTITINLNNYRDYFKDHDHQTVRVKLELKYYSSYSGIIDDVNAPEKGLNSTYIESPNFSVNVVQGPSIVQLVPDATLPSLERVSFNQSPNIIYKFTCSLTNKFSEIVFASDSYGSATTHRFRITYDTSDDPQVTYDNPVDQDYYKFGWIKTNEELVGYLVAHLPLSSGNISARNIKLIVKTSQGVVEEVVSTIRYVNFEEPAVGSKLSSSTISQLCNNIILSCNTYRQYSRQYLEGMTYSADDFLGKTCSATSSLTPGYVEKGLLCGQSSLTSYLLKVVSAINLNMSEGGLSSALDGTLLASLGGRLIIRLSNIINGNPVDEIMSLQGYSSDIGQVFGTLVYIIKYIL